MDDKVIDQLTDITNDAVTELLEKMGFEVSEDCYQEMVDIVFEAIVKARAIEHC